MKPGRQSHRGEQTRRPARCWRQVRKAAPHAARVHVLLDANATTTTLQWLDGFGCGLWAQRINQVMVRRCVDRNNINLNLVLCFIGCRVDPFFALFLVLILILIWNLILNNVN